MPHKTKTKLTAQEMVDRRRNGDTLGAIAEQAGICPTRVSQVVRRTAPELGRRMRRKMNKKEFTGVDLDVAVKDALRLHVKERGISISSFIAGAVEEKLTALGVRIIRTPINRGEPLPFE